MSETNEIRIWNAGVRGTEVLPLINADAPVIRVDAGPGTGKTFGLARRVVRILHQDGLAADADDVLVVAFNRVIAKQLRTDVEAALAQSNYEGPMPVVRTVHALCLQVVGDDRRLLLDHEREAMLYDTLGQFPALRAHYRTFEAVDQALRDHEAGIEAHDSVWQACKRWLIRHQANLLSELPPMLLDRIRGGDFPNHQYTYVIVDEFQDLTPGEQELFFRLRRPSGQLVALGDPRQSIYAFRGNDREGLSRLEGLANGAVFDVEMTECRRCPAPIVRAANTLMLLYPSPAMIAASTEQANVHVVTWQNPGAEADGMAQAISANVRTHPEESHLVMVTRRQFGYMLRTALERLAPDITTDLNFSESALESWAAREAFLLFCLLTDADAPTWRAWLGYANSSDGRNYKSPQRNSDAYLRFLGQCQDLITDDRVRALALEERNGPRGQGGTALWDRASRWCSLREIFGEFPGDPAGFVANLLEPSRWVTEATSEAEVARADIENISAMLQAILEDLSQEIPPPERLQLAARRLRYQLATRQPIERPGTAQVQIATFWGAKGVTADHVYVLGLCGEAIPGQPRDHYPGTEDDYQQEQRRLFYVSITRSKRTLVLSRPLAIARGDARKLGLAVRTGGGYWPTLAMCPFLRDLRNSLPGAVAGATWDGCS